MATVFPPTSQPLATPSISEPTTGPMERNCGRATEQPQARCQWTSTTEVSAVIPTSSQLLATPSISRADDGTNGDELWKSDGTVNGTVMVKDIYNGSYGSNAYELTVVGNTLYFSASDGTYGSELWKSDGTANGTMMVKDINIGSGPSICQFFTAVGNTLYFQADDGYQRSGIVEERRNSLWHGAGQGHQIWKWLQ